MAAESRIALMKERFYRTLASLRNLTNAINTAFIEDERYKELIEELVIDEVLAEMNKLIPNKTDTDQPNFIELQVTQAETKNINDLLNAEISFSWTAPQTNSTPLVDTKTSDSIAMVH
ncbi:unnamed protein product [Diatraea saccharalis]|uniref:Uncharacterized protein n=1 Tax=Diatraea saccharalis TaxID=40085 RepID=A0A9N9R9S7_9NEOP|nr:unnamed protein product [Diatraea saccharalis]